ncbi:MAG TPA: hypothetical protein PLO24_08805 [Bacteroidales bacterium]|jgi:hypothetical protein|nr:hypothetical protein [Bacteroidales bacterium]HOS71320.1 hypothetical protein [Bacteroidales bacterium]HQH23655.1 hypothetical protein [Bacteroidales bacterium]HQJ81177.1 hypothetical protein [Bacteroidales bacterium]
MKIVKWTFLLLTAMLMFSCSKKQEEEENQNFTVVTGEWINIFGQNVVMEDHPLLGGLCIVADEKVNEKTVVNGTAHIYLRSAISKVPAVYSYVPGEFGKNNSVELKGMLDKGYVLKFGTLPEASPLGTLHVKGLIIPKGAKLPAKLDIKDYEQVKEHFELKD